MKTIPQDLIDVIWEEALSMAPDAAEARMLKVLEAQPGICAYLVFLDEDLLPPEEQGMIMMIGYCILTCMERGGARLRKVEPEEIEDLEQANLAFLESLDEGREVDFMSVVAKMLKTYPQAPLLKTVLETLMEGYEEDLDNAPENTGMIFLHLKTVIDAVSR